MHYSIALLFGLLLLVVHDVRAQGCAPCGLLEPNYIVTTVDTANVYAEYEFNGECNPRYLLITKLGTDAVTMPVEELMEGVIQKLLELNPMGFMPPPGSSCMDIRVAMMGCWDYDEAFWSPCTSSPCCAVYRKCSDGSVTLISTNPFTGQCNEICEPICPF
jgi:hypothetical protein